MMSGEVTTFIVVDPQHPFELRSRLFRAAEIGETATFRAREFTKDEPNGSTPARKFIVKVQSAQFEEPVSFDTYDEDGTYIQLKLADFGPVEFDLVT